MDRVMSRLASLLSGSIAARRGLHPSIFLLAAVATIGFINPVREMATPDDGWAYARSVRFLLATGEYHLSAWAAANMPTQIYFAGGLSALLGYSWTTLRISTLLLLAMGCGSFYLVLREFGSDPEEAATFTFVLFCAPLVLLLGFTFNTDVHFIGWLLLAIWLYVRAIRRESLPLMLLASIPAAAAIGVRQFGMAVLGGLFVAWILSSKRRFRTAPLFLAGTVLPMATAIWQLKAGLGNASFTQAVLLCMQSRYLGQSPLHLVGEAVWRPTVVLEYAALCLIPLVPALLLLLRSTLTARGFTSSDDGRPINAIRPTRPGVLLCGRAPALLLGASAFFILLGLAYAALTSEAEGGRIIRHPMMPSIPWLVELYVSRLGHHVPPLSLLLTAFTALAAIGLGSLLSMRLLLPTPGTGEVFVVGTGVLMLGLHLLYVQMNDTYVTALLPFILFVLAQSLRDHGWPRWLMRVTGVACLCFLLPFSLFLRGEMNRLEATWAAAEQAHAAGVDRLQIVGSYHWVLYDGAFDAWVAEIGSRTPIEEYCGFYRLHNAFDEWLSARQREARYRVAVSRTPPTCPACTNIVPFRNAIFSQGYAYIAPNR